MCNIVSTINKCFIGFKRRKPPLHKTLSDRLRRNVPFSPFLMGIMWTYILNIKCWMPIYCHNCRFNFCIACRLDLPYLTSERWPSGETIAPPSSLTCLRQLLKVTSIKIEKWGWGGVHFYQQDVIASFYDNVRFYHLSFSYQPIAYPLSLFYVENIETSR